MKIPQKTIAILAGAAVLLCSCDHMRLSYVGVGVNSGYYGGTGVSASVAWTPASYDANGFPIYGYSYGRPVYGYTPDGVAIFTLAAITAACLVPLWAPAPWYHGHWHYPPHVHRVSAPPRYPVGHMPHHRPPGGMHAPIHHPNGGHHGAKPHLGHGQRPGAAPGANKPSLGHGQRPGAAPGANKPSLGHGQRPGAAPGANKPSLGHGQRPTFHSHKVNGAHVMQRPSGHGAAFRQPSRNSGVGRPAMQGGGGRGFHGRGGGGHRH